MKTRLLLLLATLVCTGAYAGDPPTTAKSPAAEPATAAALPQISQDDLLAREARHDPDLFVLDARTPEEFAQGHVPGAINIPHDQVAMHLAEIPKDKDVVLYCRTGHRAGLAADVLKANGYTRLLHLDGDMSAWMANARPVQAKALPEAIQH